MAQETYQGSPNRATWVIELWIGNERSYYNIVQSLVSDSAGDVITLADGLKDWADSIKDELQEASPPHNGIMSDLINTALWQVDWSHIAKDLLESQS